MKLTKSWGENENDYVAIDCYWTYLTRIIEKDNAFILSRIKKTNEKTFLIYKKEK